MGRNTQLVLRLLQSPFERVDRADAEEVPEATAFRRRLGVHLGHGISVEVDSHSSVVRHGQLLDQAFLEVGRPKLLPRDFLLSVKVRREEQKQTEQAGDDDRLQRHVESKRAFG